MKKHHFIKLLSIFSIAAVVFLICCIYIFQNKFTDIYKYSQIKIPLEGKIIWDNSTLKNISVKYKGNTTAEVYIFPSVDGKNIIINPPVDGFHENDKIYVTLSSKLHFKNYKMQDDKKLSFNVKPEIPSSLSKAVKNPKYGDIVGTTDNFMGYKYNHYGIYIGSGKVIHYCSSTGAAADAQIKETDMNTYFKPGNYFILNVNGSMKFTPKETVRRAETRLGEKNYNLLQNNCEHFVIWAKTGSSKSYQLSNLSQEELTKIKIFTAMGVNLQ